MAKKSPQTSSTHTFISTKDAVASLPSYTRNYVARLAREGKVVATRDRGQWLVSEESLHAFFDDSRREELVRSERIRHERYREAIAREASSPVAHHYVKGRSTLHPAAILMSGFVAGFLVFVFSALVNTYSATGVIALLDRQVAMVVESLTKSAAQKIITTQSERLDHIGVAEHDVAETVKMIGGKEGIMLLHASGSEIFSDPVEIIADTPTGGYVRFETSDDEVLVPFVKVPTS